MPHQSTFITMVTTPQVDEFPLSERPRTRLQHYGAGALSATELLACILGMPDAVAQSQELLKRFGVTGLITAPIPELSAVPGIGPHKAAQLKAALELGRRSMTADQDERPQVSSPGEAASLLMADMAPLEQEQLRLLLLDTKNRILASPTLYIGNVNTTVVRVAEVFREAVRTNCTALILAHNHPSGDPTPSPEDVNLTRIVAEAGHLMGIDVLDHVIIGRGRYVSLKERGLGFK